MTYSTTDFTAELRAVPDTNPPPCTVDLEAVRARGTALQRRRRGLGIGGGLATAGLATALVFTLAPHSGPSRAAFAPASGSGRSRGTDPLASTAAFGWLPAGLHLSGAQPDHIVASDGDSEFDVTAYKAGERPASSCSSPLTVTGAGPTAPTTGNQTPCDTAAPDVNGHHAFWALAPGAFAGLVGFDELDWEYAPDAWAVLDANIGEDTSRDIVGTMYKVAESVRFGAAVPIPLPFHLVSVPKGLSLEKAMWQGEPPAARGSVPRGDWIGAELSFGARDSSASLAPFIDLRTEPSTSTFPAPGELTAGGDPVSAADVRHLTVDGHQAVLIDVTDNGGSIQVLIVHDVAGVDFTLTVASTKPIAEVDAVGGIVAYYKSIEVLGANPKNWTTDVIG